MRRMNISQEACKVDSVAAYYILIFQHNATTPEIHLRGYLKFYNVGSIKIPAVWVAPCFRGKMWITTQELNTSSFARGDGVICSLFGCLMDLAHLIALAPVQVSDLTFVLRIGTGALAIRPLYELYGYRLEEKFIDWQSPLPVESLLAAMVLHTDFNKLQRMRTHCFRNHGRRGCKFDLLQTSQQSQVEYMTGDHVDTVGMARLACPSCCEKPERKVAAHLLDSRHHLPNVQGPVSVPARGTGYWNHLVAKHT